MDSVWLQDTLWDIQPHKKLSFVEQALKPFTYWIYKKASMKIYLLKDIKKVLRIWKW